MTTALGATWQPVPAAVWLALRQIIAPHVGATFIVPGDPVPKHRPRVGKGSAYTPKPTLAAEARVRAAFTAALPGWQAEPDRTYGVLVQFTTRSGSQVDIDNGTKLVLDALNKVFWADDIQVGMLLCNLVRAGEPGTEVLLFAVEPNGTKPTRLCDCGRRHRSDETMCSDCRKRRAIVNSLLAGDDAAAEQAELLDRQRRAVYSYLAACSIGSNHCPSTRQIVEHLNGSRNWNITAHRVQAVLATLVSDGYLAEQAGRPRYKIVKPLGAAA